MHYKIFQHNDEDFIVILLKDDKPKPVWVGRAESRVEAYLLILEKHGIAVIEPAFDGDWLYSFLDDLTKRTVR